MLIASLLIHLIGAYSAHPLQRTSGVDVNSNRRIVVVAHRAAHEEAPENSLIAIREAIRLGVDYVELDVRLTKDGALVLMHDSTVDGTTNGKGKVADLTLDEVKALSLRRRGGASMSEERVPKFEDALALCQRRMRIYVDNKSGPPEQVIAAIERHRMSKRVVIYDSVDRLRQFKRLRPGVWIMPDHPDSIDRIRELASTLKPETLDGNLRQWTAEQVEAAHHAGVQVWVDNLGENDDEAGFERAVEMGVDAIQTDHPARLIAWLRDHHLR